MSTPCTAQVNITNSTDGNAAISLWHQNSDYGTESAKWTAAPGQTVGPFTVHFNTGFGSWTVLDYWACEISVTGGTTPGLYESSGVLQYSNWKECQLQSADAGQNLVFTVDARTFDINLKSGGESTPMNPVDRVSAQAYITNNTGGHAAITLFHSNSTDGTQSGTWTAAPGEQVGPLTVYFRVGLAAGLVPDYWAMEAAVKDGPAPGVFQSQGFASLTGWKECQLQSADVDQNLTFAVSPSSFDINLASGGCTDAMTRLGEFSKITNVFVLMLENRSFDNLFGQSGIPGITQPRPRTAMPTKVPPTPVRSPAPTAMPTDPGHEFSGCPGTIGRRPDARYPPGGPYTEPINLCGFAANYATAKPTTDGQSPPATPTSARSCSLRHQAQLPVIHQLATEFAICDHWFSSLPGPTWPNRFFVHGASSGAWADRPSPTSDAVVRTWETPRARLHLPPRQRLRRGGAGRAHLADLQRRHRRLQRRPAGRLRLRRDPAGIRR